MNTTPIITSAKVLYAMCSLYIQTATHAHAEVPPCQARGLRKYLEEKAPHIARTITDVSHTWSISHSDYHDGEVQVDICLPLDPNQPGSISIYRMDKGGKKVA